MKKCPTNIKILGMGFCAGCYTRGSVGNCDRQGREGGHIAILKVGEYFQKPQKLASSTPKSARHKPRATNIKMFSTFIEEKGRRRKRKKPNSPSVKNVSKTAMCHPHCFFF